jgi:hypothetical protein
MNNKVATIDAPANTLISLLRAAVDKGADVATLERLAKLYETAEQNELKKEFNNALAAAKAELRPVTKDKAVGSLYKYETMAAIAAEIDPVLGKHGLYAIFPDPEHTEKREPNRIYVTCRLCHKNGYSIEKTLDAPPDAGQNRNAVQAMGSTMTYLQRYSLRAILGLAVAQDKDGKKERFADRPDAIAQPAGRTYAPAKPELIADVEEWQDWSAILLMMINGAATVDLVDKWLDVNQAQLRKLLKDIPAHHAFVMREVNKRLRKLRGASAA